MVGAVEEDEDLKEERRFWAEDLRRMDGRGGSDAMGVFWNGNGRWHLRSELANRSSKRHSDASVAFHFVFCFCFLFVFLGWDHSGFPR